MLTEQLNMVNDIELQFTPKLTLTVIDAPEQLGDQHFKYTLVIGHQFLINAQGMLVNGKAKRRDGCTIFGTSGDISNTQLDVVLGCNGPEEEGPVIKKHFIIKYRQDTKTYNVRDTGEGTGTFIRIDKPYALQNGSLISFGESHMAA